MRRIIILGLLFGLMYVLQFLQVEAETAFSAKSLATVGFILLAAYTLGEITGRFGLPKITGYILTGLVFGPYVIDLFSVEVVNDLKIINGLAIGLIALSAGGEMKVSSLKQIARSLTLIVIIKGTLILAAVMGAVYGVATLMPQALPFLAGESTALILAVGGLFGVLAIGTSPAATIAVINETGAKGRLADTTLGVAVFKDVVMVILLAIFIALAKVFSTPEAVFDPLVLLHVGEELGLSLLAGALLGGLIIGYVRFLGAEMWLFVIAIIFSMNTVAEIFHLEALLMFITAGFVVQNFSKHGDNFVHLIESVALPVYVVFFSVAGAGLNLNALVQVGLAAGTLVVVRLIAIYAGTRLATKLAREPEPIQRHAWLSFVSQAGVVIGLTIIITNNLPALGPQITTVVLGTIAINLLAGPVLFKLALAKVGEIQGETPTPEAVPEPTAETPDAPMPVLPEPPSEVYYPEPAFTSAKMTREAWRLQEQLVRLQQDFQDQFIAQKIAKQQDFLTRIHERHQETLANLQQQLAETDSDPTQQSHLFRESRTAFSRWLQSEVIAFGMQPDRTEAARQTFKDFSETIHEKSKQVETRFVVNQEPARFEPTPGDSLYVRFRKALKRAGEQVSSLLGSGVRDTRTVPFQRIAQYHLDGLLPGQMIPVANMTGALPLFTLDKIRLLHRQIDDQYTTIIDGLQPEDGAPLAMDAALLATMQQETDGDFGQTIADVAHYGEEMKQRLAFALVQRYDAVLKDLERAGTFELPARQRRFSLVYQQSQKAHAEIRQVLDAWHEYTRGAAGTVAKRLDVVILADHVGRIVDETVVQVSAAIQDQVGAHVETARAACAQQRDTLDHTFDQAGPALRRTLAAQQQTLIETLDKEAIAPLVELRQSRLLNALIDRMLQRFSDLAADVPETYEVIPWEDQPGLQQASATPGTPRMKMAPMRQVTRAYLETRLARTLAEANQSLFREVDAAIQALTEIRQLVRFNLQAALDELEPTASDEHTARARELAFGGLERSQNRLQKTHEQVEQFAAQIHHQIHNSTTGLIPALEKEIAGETRLGLRLHQQQQRTFTRVSDTLLEAHQTFDRRLRGLIIALQRRFRPFAEDLLGDYRASLPLNQLTPEEVLSRYDQATLSPAHIDRLPFIYQKLFALAPLESDEFLIGRQAEKHMFELALRRWALGRSSSIAVTGEPGAGVSSFLHWIQRSTRDHHPVHHITFTQPPSSEEALVRFVARRLALPRAQTFEELARLLKSATDRDTGRIVVLLEDAHYLYRRTPGGFDLLKGLLLLITTTGNQVLWVLSMNHHAWRYLDAVLGLTDAFAFNFPLPPLTREELETAVLARHRFSGLDLRFTPSASMRQRRKYRRASDEEQQRLLQNAFFDQLYRRTGGNPLAAQFYWMRAIDAVEQHQITIARLARQRFGYVRGLDVEALLTLKVVLQQGVLTLEDHTTIFGMKTEASHTTLMHLVNLNLLTREDRMAPITFRLNTAIYKPLAQELEALNLLA